MKIKADYGTRLPTTCGGYGTTRLATCSATLTLSFIMK